MNFQERLKRSVFFPEEGKNAYKYFKRIFFTYFVWNLLDIGYTAWGVRLYGWWMEANPVWRWLLMTGNYWLALVAEVALLALFFLSLRIALSDENIRKLRRKWTFHLWDWALYLTFFFKFFTIITWILVFISIYAHN